MWHDLEILQSNSSQSCDFPISPKSVPFFLLLFFDSSEANFIYKKMPFPSDVIMKTTGDLNNVSNQESPIIVQILMS